MQAVGAGQYSGTSPGEQGGSMADRLKAVLVGCGVRSGKWLEAAQSMEELSIVGLVDLEERRAAERRKEFKLDVPIGVDLEGMLAAERPDVVFDCTVPSAHAAVTLRALARGCHVLGEKPMATSMSEARKVVRAATEAGLIYAVVQNRRYEEPIRRLRKVVTDGVIGTTTTVNTDFYVGAHFGGFRDHMEHPLILDMAIHTFDAARLLTGADPLSVYCREWNPAGSWYDHPASAVAVFELEGGIVYTYRGSWCAEGLNTGWEGEWRIVGSRGTAIWEGGDRIRCQTVAVPGGFISKMSDVPIPELDQGQLVDGQAVIRL